MTRNEYLAHIANKASEMAEHIERQGRNAADVRAVPEIANELPESRFVGDADALFGNLLRVAQQRASADRMAARRVAK